MLSVRFFGRRVIRCGQNSSCHYYVACLKTDFCITKKRPVYSLMNALINCNNVSYSLKGTSEKKKSAQLIPMPCCIFSVENKWNNLQKGVYFCCTHVSLCILYNLRNRGLECVLNSPGGFHRNPKATFATSLVLTHSSLLIIICPEPRAENFFQYSESLNGPN